MKDLLKWWSILLVALLSVYITSHFAAKAQRTSQQTAEKVDQVAQLLKTLVEQSKLQNASIKRVSDELESARLQLVATAETNRTILERLTLLPPDDQAFADPNPRSAVINESLNPTSPENENLNLAIRAFDQRKLDFRQTLEPLKTRMLEGLRDSTVEMIFKNTELAGIETPADLKALTDELRESGELQKMYDGIESSILGNMMLGAFESEGQQLKDFQ